MFLDWLTVRAFVKAHVTKGAHVARVEFLIDPKGRTIKGRVNGSQEFSLPLSDERMALVDGLAKPFRDRFAPDDITAANIDIDYNAHRAKVEVFYLKDGNSFTHIESHDTRPSY